MQISPRCDAFMNLWLPNLQVALLYFNHKLGNEKVFVVFALCQNQ